MTGDTKRFTEIFEKAEQPYARSSLFLWLLENHDRLLEAAGAKRLEWGRLCSEFERHGLSDATGKPASRRTARQTWWRVRKERERLAAKRLTVDAERAAKAAANTRRNMPSQFPKKDSWRPPAVTSEKRSQNEEIWNENYRRDEKGYVWAVSDIREHKNLASHAKRRQEMNESVGRDRDDGIEVFIGHKQEI
jgi:hypothetical protein